MRYLKVEYLYFIPLMLSAIFCLKAFRQKWPRHYRLYASMIIVSLIFESIAVQWPHELHRVFKAPGNNFWIYNLFILVRFSMLSGILYQALKQHPIKKILPAVIVTILFIGLLDYTTINGPNQYNTYSMLLTHVCIIVLCLYYFRQLLQEPGFITLHKEPLVWLTLSIFFYHAVSLPFLISLGFFNQNNLRLTELFLPINDILNFSLCTCYLISFLWNPQSTQPH